MDSDLGRTRFGWEADVAIPEQLACALRPVTVVVGHYGAGKTNFAVNVAVDLVAAGKRVALIDLDVVNPYFRATEQRSLLEDRGVRLVAPVFSEAGTSLDVPSLTGAVSPTIRNAGEDDFVIVDAGGDDVGATALGRFARDIAAGEHAMLYVANRFRNLVQDPADALENLREIEAASHLMATAIVGNSHLKDATTPAAIELGAEYAAKLAAMAALPVVCVTVPPNVSDVVVDKGYPVECFVKSPWE